MSTFAPALPPIAPYDPTKHVNYSVGMVLGVDDFNQEFTYLAARDQRALCTACGYGVFWGLRVTVDDIGGRGPRVQVSPGAAGTPSGRLICISPAQCAYLNDWVASNVATAEAAASPPAGALTLAVVACYQECPTDNVPIPGEPCRTADELMAPSRLQESFKLELRLAPPAQVEEDGVRDFVAWLRRIPIVDGSGTDLGVMLATLRSLVGVDSSPPASSPPGSALDLLIGSPPVAIEIPRSQQSTYIGALMTFWVEELRPLLLGSGSGNGCGCGSTGGTAGAIDPDANCVLLAELDVPLAHDPVSGALVVGDVPPVSIDESRRPMLLHQRLLQELLLSGDAVGGAQRAVSARVGADGTVQASNGGLSVRVLTPGIFALTFPGYDPSAQYATLGQVIGAFSETTAPTFECIPSTDASLATALGGPPPPGIVVRVGTPGEGGLQPAPFMVRIEPLGGPA